MANGRFTLWKESGWKLGLVFPDGVTNTEVALHENGELATKDYVSKALISGSRGLYPKELV